MNWVFDPAQNGIAIVPCAWLHAMRPSAAGDLVAPKFSDVLGRVRCI